MGIEGLFNRKKQEERTLSHDTNEEDSAVLSRRSFLTGASAFVGATALGSREAHADMLKGIFSLFDRESLNANVERIKAYAELLKQHRPIFENLASTQQELIDAFIPAPALEWSVIEGTELDHEALFRQQGSWPAVQVRDETLVQGPQIRFAQEQNIEPAFGEKGHLENYGDAFFVDGIFMSNRHMLLNKFACEVGAPGDDIAGCSLDDITLNAQAKINIDRVDQQWDRRKVEQDLHGSIVHIPSIHELRGRSSDNTEITSGVLLKITDAFLWTQEKDLYSFFNQKVTQEYGDVLRNSYMCIIPPMDVNNQQIVSADDLKGISGSPVFTDEDCKNGVRMPSGIVWGASSFSDVKTGTTYTVILIHGPDVLGSMIDTVNTVVSGDMDETTHPQKKALAGSVQDALNKLGYSIPVDGLYGDTTKQAVFDFQKRSFTIDQLKSSVILGEVDRRTWNKLFPQPEPLNKRVLYNSIGA